ncbi:hypothetical protein LOTGIDRAFT_232556 [Lottia gigantea]|uniref:Uncharacterized protein n=1 Tax=Lottia gigantea TaxID=225164 RepID=V4AL66_LOTGI|nr:hypothetical protein LOTGIDRAFT_232556 [Lottia gigantea]ESO94326.1 hypothetical protein LOTGIDRAFT_232556 [Lottia gigantea]
MLHQYRVIFFLGIIGLVLSDLNSAPKDNGSLELKKTRPHRRASEGAPADSQSQQDQSDNELCTSDGKSIQKKPSLGSASKNVRNLSPALDLPNNRPTRKQGNKFRIKRSGEEGKKKRRKRKRGKKKRKKMKGGKKKKKMKQKNGKKEKPNESMMEKAVDSVVEKAKEGEEVIKGMMGTPKKHKKEKGKKSKAEKGTKETKGKKSEEGKGKEGKAEKGKKETKGKKQTVKVEISHAGSKKKDDWTPVDISSSKKGSSKPSAGQKSDKVKIKVAGKGVPHSASTTNMPILSLLLFTFFCHQFFNYLV